MKKTIGAIALVLAVFSMLYMSNTAFADKATISIAPSTQTVDLSLGTVANFEVTDLGGASSVKIVARNSSSLDAFQIVTSLGNVTATGNYTRTAQQMVDQFGYVSLEWKAVQNEIPNQESSLAAKTIQE